VPIVDSDPVVAISVTIHCIASNRNDRVV
jgi:hypothetical protein